MNVTHTDIGNYKVRASWWVVRVNLTCVDFGWEIVTAVTHRIVSEMEEVTVEQ